MLTAATASAKDLGLAKKLPPLLRQELEDLHFPPEGKKKKRGGAGANSFTLNMDARVLLEHVEDGVPLAQIRWPDRKQRAARTRWQDHLSSLQNLNELRERRPTMPADAGNACNASATTAEDCGSDNPSGGQLDSVDGGTVQTLRDELESLRLQHVPQHVQDGLIGMHARSRNEAAAKKPWSITQDGQLLDDYLGGEEAVDIIVHGRKYGAVKRRLHTLRHRLSASRCAFHRIKCDAEAPYLHLKYDEWTAITPDHAIPPQAEVDWLKGVARAPASWELRLDSRSFCLYDREADARIDVGPTDVFELEDVRPDMTIGDVLGHVRSWMRASTWPAIAHGLAHEDLCLAMLPAAPLPQRDDATPTEQVFARGARVQYQSRDGRARAATVRAVNTRAKPQRCTIAFDTDQLCVSSACLFSTKPPPPSATVDDAAVDDAAEALQQQFRCGQRVWYYDAAPQCRRKMLMAMTQASNALRASMLRALPRAWCGPISARAGQSTVLMVTPLRRWTVPLTRASRVRPSRHRERHAVRG